MSGERIIGFGNPASNRLFDLLDILVAIKMQLEPGPNGSGCCTLSQIELEHLHDTVVRAIACLKEIAGSDYGYPGETLTKRMSVR